MEITLWYLLVQRVGLRLQLGRDVWWSASCRWNEEEGCFKGGDREAGRERIGLVGQSSLDGFVRQSEKKENEEQQLGEKVRVGSYSRHKPIDQRWNLSARNREM